MLGSDLEDIITIWLDSAAEPIAVSISSLGPCILDNPFTNMWTTNVVVRYPDGGPIPDTAMYIQKLEREREARERGETKDNRSFLAKYVSIFLLKEIYILQILHAVHFCYTVDVYCPCVDISAAVICDKSRSCRRRKCTKTMIF